MQPLCALGGLCGKNSYSTFRSMRCMISLGPGKRPSSFLFHKPSPYSRQPFPGHPRDAQDKPILAAGSRDTAHSETAAEHPRKRRSSRLLRPLPKEHSPRAMGAAAVFDFHAGLGCIHSGSPRNEQQGWQYKPIPHICLAKAREIPDRDERGRSGLGRRTQTAI